MDKPTVAELTRTTPTDNLQGLINFLAQLPSSQEAAILYAACLAGVVGMIGSWVVKYYIQKTVDDFIFSYFFRTSQRRTFGTFFTYLGVVITLITTGTFTHDGGIFVGWQNVFSVCIGYAFGADMGINKGTRPIWTATERQEAVDKKLEAAAAEAPDKA